MHYYENCTIFHPCAAPIRNTKSHLLSNDESVSGTSLSRDAVNCFPHILMLQCTSSDHCEFRCWRSVKMMCCEEQTISRLYHGYFKGLILVGHLRPNKNASKWSRVFFWTRGSKSTSSVVPGHDSCPYSGTSHSLSLWTQHKIPLLQPILGSLISASPSLQRYYVLELHHKN